jgi:hypothetical protein
LKPALPCPFVSVVAVLEASVVRKWATTVAELVAGPTIETVTVVFCAGAGFETDAVHPAADAGIATATIGTPMVRATAAPRNRRLPERTRT